MTRDDLTPAERKVYDVLFRELSFTPPHDLARRIVAAVTEQTASVAGPVVTAEDLLATWGCYARTSPSAIAEARALVVRVNRRVIEGLRGSGWKGNAVELGPDSYALRADLLRLFCGEPRP